METVRTNVRLRELFKKTRTYETFEDFVDHVLRTGLIKLGIS